MVRLYRYRRSEDEPTVNLTPLIDVVFSILIMFIVVAPLLETDNIELAGAGPAAKEVALSFNDAGPITIHVGRDNRVQLNRRPVELGNLASLLREEKKKYPAASPRVFHDRKAQFGVYQQIKNACESAGFDNMDVILSPDAQ